MTRFVLLAAIAACASSLAAAAPAPARPTVQRNIVQTAAAAGQFKTLVKLIKQAGLASVLQKRGPYTVFAPTDAAFKQVPRATLATLANDRAKLRAVLLYHVVKGDVTAARAMRLHAATTVAGKPVSIRMRRGKLIVGGATVVKADVVAANGVIHAIDRVLIP